MQATQSRRASGSWRRTGQFAALRYVSRHLEIDAGLTVGDSVEWERSSRSELLRVGEEPLPMREYVRVFRAELSSQGIAKRESGTAGWPRC